MSTTDNHQGQRVEVTDTPYHLVVSGTGPDTTLTVYDQHGQPASAFTLQHARRVALALVDTSIFLDAWPPYAQRPEGGPSAAAPWTCPYPTQRGQR